MAPPTSLTPFQKDFLSLDKKHERKALYLLIKRCERCEGTLTVTIRCLRCHTEAEFTSLGYGAEPSVTVKHHEQAPLYSLREGVVFCLGHLRSQQCLLGQQCVSVAHVKYG